MSSDSEFLLAAQSIVAAARQSTRVLANAPTLQKNKLLAAIATSLLDPEQQRNILAANAEDLRLAKKAGLAESLLDRLLLTAQRLRSVAASLQDMMNLPDPIGNIQHLTSRPSGVLVGRMRVPLGLILMIYESRPNVTIDAAALCLKAGNAVILRGGKEAMRTNALLVAVIHAALEQVGLPRDAAVFVDNTDHGLLYAMLGLQGQIDLAIPRGGVALIEAVVRHAKVPVIQHYKGVCHVYVEASADLAMALQIVVNAKVQRPGVCNAMECLLIDRAIAAEFLPQIITAFAKHHVTVRGCKDTLAFFAATLPSHVEAASDEDFDSEYLSLTCAVKIVDDFNAALSFLATHGSQHTEAIVTSNHALAMRFLREVDASCILVNASTRFNDGGELGLGAELGISTSKLHAYGPMGLEELCAQKFVVLGSGQVRE